MINSILVPLDGSKLSEEALPHVETLAKQLQAEVYLLEVVSLDPALLVAVSAGAPANPALIDQELQADTKEMETYLAGIADGFQAKGISAKWEVLLGTPAPTIIKYARAHKVGLIAMSTHGRSGLSRLVFGSVAEEVLRGAPCPVMLIRPGQRTS